MVAVFVVAATLVVVAATPIAVVCTVVCTVVVVVVAAVVCNVVAATLVAVVCTVVGVVGVVVAVGALFLVFFLLECRSIALLLTPVVTAIAVASCINGGIDEIGLVIHPVSGNVGLEATVRLFEVALGLR